MFSIYQKQARTQDFVQEGDHLLSKGSSGHTGAPRRLSAPKRSGAPATRGPLGDKGPRKPGAHWIIRGPSGNQGHMDETLLSIFLPSKRRCTQCLKKKHMPGPEGPPE